MGKYSIKPTFVDPAVTQQAIMVEPCQILFKVMERIKSFQGLIYPTFKWECKASCMNCILKVTKSGSAA